MIVERRPFEGICGGMHCRIWLDAPAPATFAEFFLAELVALAAPAGLGHVEALARRREDEAAKLSEALRHAIQAPNGQKNHGDRHVFDYVSGYRIKVTFWPKGLPEGYEDTGCASRHGLPLISSVEFEQMYGKGSLEGAARLALDRCRTQL